MHKNIKLTPIPESIQLVEMSDEEYFGEAWTGYISNSRLALINPDQGGSPEKYKEGLGKNSKYSDSLVLGSAVHAIVLQPSSFQLVPNVDRPTAKMGAMADRLYSVFLNSGNITDSDIIDASDEVDYYKGKMDEKKIQNVKDKCTSYWQDRRDWSENMNFGITPIFLDPKSREKLNLCVKGINDNREVQALLHPEGIFNDPVVMNEAVLFMDVKASYEEREEILHLKAKLDNFTIDADTGDIVLNDLKTTGHWLCDFNESFKTYHYNRQMAMYVWMLNVYVEHKYGIKPASLTANMLLSCTVPDYRAGIYKVANGEIQKGFKEFKDLLQRVAYLTLHDESRSSISREF